MGAASQIGAEINRGQNELVLRIELDDRFIDLRAVGLDSQRKSGCGTGPTGVRGEESWRNVGDVNGASRDRSVRVGKRYRAIARRRVARDQEVDLCRRNEKERRRSRYPHRINDFD